MSARTKTSILYRIGTEAEQDMPVTGYIDSGVRTLFELDAIPPFFKIGDTGMTALSIGCGVTTIGLSAFDGCTNLTGLLEIPESVRSIGSNAFNGTLFSTVNFLNPIPPEDASANAFGYPYNTAIHVPAGSLAAYQSTFPDLTIIDDL